VFACFNYLWANNNLAECNFQVSAHVGSTGSGFTGEFFEALATGVSRRTFWEMAMVADASINGL